MLQEHNDGESISETLGQASTLPKASVAFSVCGRASRSERSLLRGMH